MKAREATKRYRLSKWAETIQERTSSGERVEEFCIRKGISKYQYFYWLRKLRSAAGEQLTELEPAQTKLAVRGFAEVKVAEPSSSYSAVGNNQICIETGYCRLTAGSGYPADALVTLLSEVIKP